MFGLDQVSVGIILALVGAGLIGLLFLLLRVLPRRSRVSVPMNGDPVISTEIGPNESAVILVQPGGRLIYLNSQAREWFGISENETPNLERMSRRTRPADAFLGLCAAAGQVNFTLDQSLVEGMSFTVPYQDRHAVLVSLQRPQFTNLEEGRDTLSMHAITIFTEISRAMSASLDLETTIQTILESIDRLIPSDFSEITRWVAEETCFIPFRFLTEEDGIRRVSRSDTDYTLDKGFTGYLASHSEPLLVNDVVSFEEVRPAVSRAQFPIQSYLGIPLKIGGQLIGTIELASQTVESFTEEDKEVLELLSGHAAVALQNAVTHHKEQERVQEMAGLANLSQVNRAVASTENLYQQLISTISPLIDAEILGFLIYDETTRTLEGKIPFQGLPEQFTLLYRTKIEEASRAEEVWQEQDVIITDDMSEESVMGALGLAPLAQASAMRETVFVPLNSGMRPLGYLQVANKRDGSRFSDGDLRLLRIISGQVASILENANLMQQSRRRAQRAEVLRRVASLAGSEATQDETLQFSLLELSRFLQADVAAAFLLDESLGILQVHGQSILGIGVNQISKISLHLVTQANLKNTVTETQTAIISADILNDDNLPQPYRALQPLLPEVHSLIVSPLVVRGRSIGEILFGSKQRSEFDRNDQQSVETAADQIASAIERATLINQTDESLQRRAEEMSSINLLTRKFAVTDNIENVLRMIHQEAVRISKADAGGILIFGQTEDGQTPLWITHRVGDAPMEITGLDQHAINRKEPIYLPDLTVSSFSEEFFGMASGLVVPINKFGQVVGVLRLFSRQQNYFDKTAQDLIHALASQTGVTLSNIWEYHAAASRTSQLTEQAQALNQLLDTRKQIAAETSLEPALEVLATSIREISQFDVVLIYLYDPQYKTVRPAILHGVTPEDQEVLSEILHPWENIQSLMQSEFQRSRSYYVPHERVEDNTDLIPDFVTVAYSHSQAAEQRWTPGDQLLVPLYDARLQPLGLIVVDAPKTGAVPTDAMLEMLELFASETALVIQSYSQTTQLQSQINEVETQIAQAEAEMQAAQGSPQLAMLLQKDLEQTIALDQLYHRARNIRIGLDIADTVNRQPDRQSVLNSLASQLLTEMELDIALVVEPSAGGPRLLGQFGPIASGANPQALLGQRNPLRQALQSGEMIFESNLDEHSEWYTSPLLRSLDARGLICLPISANDQVDAAVLAVSNVPLTEMTREDEQVYELIGNQVSLTLQNLNLLTETRRRLREVNLLLEFSRQLGSLDSHEILKTLVKSIRRVLPHAHGLRVMLWDEEKQALNTETALGYNQNELLTKIPHGFSSSIIEKSFEQGNLLNISEVQFATDFEFLSEDLLQYREATGGRLPVSMLLVPIRTADEMRGLVELDNFNTVSAFSEEDQVLVESLAQQIALALENARLYAESQRINEILEKRVAERTQALAQEHQFSQILLKISTELSSSLDLDMVLNRSLAMLQEATGAEQCNILISRPPEPHFIFRAGAGIHESPPMGGSPSALKVEEGIAGWVIKNQQALIVKDLLKDQVWSAAHGVNPVYRSTLTAPLIVGQDALGCLMLFHRAPGHFSDNQIDAIQAAANQFAVTINNGELFQLIRDQAEDLGNLLRTQQVEATRSTAMLEGVGDGVLVTEKNNEITLFNEAAEAMLELKRSQVLGKSLEEFVGLFGGTAKSWMDTIRSWSANPELSNSTEMYQERLFLEDGRVISVHLSPVQNRGEFQGTISIFRDITHQVEVDRLKSEFVATVSHELRTPMTPIKGYVEFLLMGGAGQLNEQQLEFVSIIKTNIDRLSILVDDLLDVSRIEAGKVSLTFQPIDMREVIDDSVETLVQLSQEEQHPVMVDVHIPEDLPSVYGDLERVRQIVANLLDNAYKYSPENSTIVIRITQENSSVQVDIIDKGVGIFPDEHEKIFERFYRGENHMVMETAGTGLGLPIVKELVELHKGKIWLTSSGVPGEGSTFSFTLPIYQPEHEPILHE
ncbi:MAG TPA: GAF domain-containing protein [Anaerolineales bacterium]|jgi:PAS domain S-box-containing protein|nr:GAF domain-containing protein [Anaerolineales bacterium]